MTYIIDYDPPDGHTYMPEQNPFRGREFATVEAARAALGSRIEGKEQWSPDADAEFAEGYYESEDEGCGSWVILGSNEHGQGADTMTIIPTEPRELLTYLEWAEVDGNRAADARRVLRDERFSLLAALKTGDPAIISSARDEAVRVARMWGGL